MPGSHAHANSSDGSRRLRGVGDVAWVVFIFASFAVVAFLLVAHLRVEFEAYRLGHERAEAMATQRELLHMQRRLKVERQVRVDELVRPETVRRELGMGPIRPEQVIDMTEAP